MFSKQKHVDGTFKGTRKGRFINNFTSLKSFFCKNFRLTMEGFWWKLELILKRFQNNFSRPIMFALNTYLVLVWSKKGLQWFGRYRLTDDFKTHFWVQGSIDFLYYHYTFSILCSICEGINNVNKDVTIKRGQVVKMLS